MKHKSTLLILLLLVCAALLVTGSFAAYTNVEYIKRVVSTRAGANDLRFSSNYLSPSSSDVAPTQLISVSMNSNISVTVTVCNYPQNDTTLISEDNITYTLTAKLVHRDGTEIGADENITYTAPDGSSTTMTGAKLAACIQINGTAASGCSWSFSDQTLTGGTGSRELYKITCDASGVGCLSTVALELKATPSSGVNTSLAAQLRFAAATAVDSNWTHKFTDSLDGDTKKLDAFNVELSGTSQGTGVLSWDTTHVQIGQWSIAELGGSGNPGSITLTLGGPDQPTRYRLQFYRVGGIPENETASDVRGYVSFFFTPGQSQSGTD